MGFEVIPTVGFGLFFVESSKLRHLPLPLVSLFPPSHPTVHNPPYKTLERPFAMFALYTNIKIPGQLQGLPCKFVLFCKLFFSFRVIEFALTMPFSPSHFIRERDVIIVPSSWDVICSCHPSHSCSRCPSRCPSHSRPCSSPLTLTVATKYWATLLNLSGAYALSANIRSLLLTFPGAILVTKQSSTSLCTVGACGWCVCVRRCRDAALHHEQQK